MQNIIPAAHIRELPLNAEQLIARLERAGRTLARLPGKSCFPAGFRSAWPEVMRDPADASDRIAGACASAPPAAGDIDEMEEALGWISLIRLERPCPGSGQLAMVHGGAVRRRLVWRRALWDLQRDRPLLSWRAIARLDRCAPESARAWHGQGIDEIVRALKQAQRTVRQGIDRGRTELQIGRILGQSSGRPSRSE